MNKQQDKIPQDKGIIKEDALALEAELKRGKNYIFAIGINTYQHFTPLSNARKDVEDLADVLVKNYYFEQEHIQLLCDNEAIRGNIIEELTDLSKKSKKMTVYS